MITSFIDSFLGINHVHLGYIGVFSALLGLLCIMIIIFPTQVKEARKSDGIRNTRIALPLLSLTITFMFINALYITFLRLVIQGHIGTQAQNDSRFFIGGGVGLLAVLLYIIYKKGGDLQDKL